MANNLNNQFIRKKPETNPAEPDKLRESMQQEVSQELGRIFARKRILEQQKIQTNNSSVAGDPN